MDSKTRNALRAWVDETSVAVVADHLYVSEDTISRWVAGATTPSSGTVERIEARLAERKAAK